MIESISTKGLSKAIDDLKYEVGHPVHIIRFEDFGYIRDYEEAKQRRANGAQSDD